jgi:protein-L-isoaspartate(D-aspartate) O-methyltransferase
VQSVEKYQKQLLDQTRHIYYETPLSQATEQAYWACPRHEFVKHYRVWGSKEWRDVTGANLEEHLAALYTDQALILLGEDDAHIPSTISQPSFVLRMLDLLQIKPGQRVFELGTGSGWNAALLGHLVGPEGHVYSLEIIPEVARAAVDNLARLHIDNVSVIEADGGEGYAPGAPYDRAAFTAGTYDLPRQFHEQIREGGLLLVVIKSEGGGDNLFLLRKTGDHFESLDSMPCGFVQMMGKYHLDSLEPVCLEDLPEWADLQHQEVSRTPFWWGGKGKQGFEWRTLGIRSFLGITEPRFRAFKTRKADERSHEEHYFGLWDQPGRSLVVAQDDLLIAYGTSAAKERLMQCVQHWVTLGMPSASSLSLKVYPRDAPLVVGTNAWLVRRSESQFLWSLPV